jgi:hypothetical protein
MIAKEEQAGQTTLRPNETLARAYPGITRTPRSSRQVAGKTQRLRWRELIFNWRRDWRSRAVMEVRPVPRQHRQTVEQPAYEQVDNRDDD